MTTWTADELLTAPRAAPRASQSLMESVDAFVLSRRVGNCSVATLRIYRANLGRFTRAMGNATLAEVTLSKVQQYLTGLQPAMKPVSAHQHFRTLRTFFRWAVDANLLATTPMHGITMRLPKTLPRAPEDDTVRRLLAACSDSFEGRRNRAMVSLLADSGLRRTEVLRLRIEDVNFGTRTLSVRGGKGGKDGVGHFGAETAGALRAWLAVRPQATPEDFLFVSREGRPLSKDYVTPIAPTVNARRSSSQDRTARPAPLRGYEHPQADR